MTTRILVLRHGESVANKEKFFASRTNVPLTDLGVKQAKAAAEALKDVHIDRVFSSTLDRAYYTALPFAEMRGLDVTRVEALIERDCGIWTGKTIDEVTRLYPDEKVLFNEGDINFKITGGESSREMINRVGEALDRLAEENKGLTILVAAHGGIIKGIPYYYAEDKTDDVYNNTKIPTNCSITEIVYEGKKGTVIRYSDDSYLGSLRGDAFMI